MTPVARRVSSRADWRLLEHAPGSVSWGIILLTNDARGFDMVNAEGARPWRRKPWPSWVAVITTCFYLLLCSVKCSTKS